jgi:hypothetical protein
MGNKDDERLRRYSGSIPMETMDRRPVRREHTCFILPLRSTNHKPHASLYGRRPTQKKG